MEIRLVLNYNRSRSINVSTLEGNAFEAIIGAIYLDGGYDKAKQSLNNYVFRKYLNFNKLLEEEIDFKSKLFIWCQRKKLNLDFLVVKEYQENSQWNYIKNLRVVNFKYKEDVQNEGDNALRQIGFIAQEVEQVSPGLVYEASKKGTDETWKSVKTSIIEIKAIKALQEAMLKIEALEEKLERNNII